MLQWQSEWYAGLEESHAGILAEKGDYEVKAERVNNCVRSWKEKRKKDQIKKIYSAGGHGFNTTLFL